MCNAWRIEKARFMQVITHTSHTLMQVHLSGLLLQSTAPTPIPRWHFQNLQGLTTIFSRADPQSSATEPHADSPQRIVLAQNRSIHNDSTRHGLDNFQTVPPLLPRQPPQTISNQCSKEIWYSAIKKGVLSCLCLRNFSVQKGRDGKLGRDLRGMKTRV